MNSQINRALRDCIGVFERLEIPYVIMGGFAVRAYAFPRPTFDVDFTVSFPVNRLSELFNALDECGYTTADMYRKGWLDRVGGMPLVKSRLYLEGDVSYGIDIDIFVSESPYQKMLLERRQRVVVDDDFEAWFVSPEDLVLLKLIASRPKDLVDIGDILLAQGRLDEDYMRGWAAELNVLAKLDDVLRQYSD